MTMSIAGGVGVVRCCGRSSRIWALVFFVTF
jgi:hypothetical protein